MPVPRTVALSFETVQGIAGGRMPDVAGLLGGFGDAPPHDLHARAISMVERPLFEAVLEKTGGNQLKAAEILGKQAALLVPSGTMANQSAVKVHTDPGDEVIILRPYYFNHEMAAVMAGVRPGPGQPGHPRQHGWHEQQDVGPGQGGEAQHQARGQDPPVPGQGQGHQRGEIGEQVEPPHLHLAQQPEVAGHADHTESDDQQAGDRAAAREVSAVCLC